MSLLSVELSGFKSFAHRTELWVSPGLTAVIGPNGSGKSNVAEAIRWVLGEQSLKQLRCNDSTDIIFAGNDQVPPRPAALVRLTFNNESQVFPVDAPEVTVARRLTRRGDSEYLLNGDAVRLIDVQQLLAEAGMGARTYTVISQGMVSRYIECAPGERRDLFDEATGVKALQLKLQRAQRDLRETERLLDEVRRVAAEIEPRRRVLLRQVERASRRASLEETYQKAETTWLTARWHEQAARVAEAHTTATAAEVHVQQTKQARRQTEEPVFSQPAGGAGTSSAAINEWLAPLREEIAWCLTTLEQSEGKPAHLAAVKKRLAALHSRLNDSNTPLTLTKLLGQHQSSSPEERSKALHRAEIERVRTAELAAERAFGMARANELQADSALTELISLIRRERGDVFLEALKKNKPPAADTDTSTLGSDVQRLAGELSKIGEIDPLAQKEYEQVNERYQHVTSQLSDIEAAYRDTSVLEQQVLSEMDSRFSQQFKTIQQAFAEYFTHLFGGGSAALELTPEGIDVTVHPPGKRIHHVHLLSGGEKALTALALFLAIISIQRPPFLVLDEVDAALDDTNAERFVSLLKQKTAHTQCIMISHNRETMAHADVLHGVMMDKNGISKTYSLKLEPATAA